MPFAGDLPRAAALRELAVLQAGVMTRQTGSRPSGFPPMAGKAEPTQSFLELEAGALAVSAVKPAEDGSGDLIVRLWNPEGKRQTGVLRLWCKVKSAAYTDLRELPLKGAVKPQVKVHAITVSASAYRIITLRIKF